MESKTVLKNGLTVLHEKRDVSVTTVMLAAKYGAAYESPKEKGFAHFLEHLCFKGTKTRSAKQIAYTLEKVGGYLNAFTDEEETAFHVTLPSKELELAMDVIFDMYFNSIFPNKELKKEANVICEEIKRLKDTPSNYVCSRLKACLYKSPFGMSIAGTAENVRSITKKQLLNKHREIYTPDNSLLAVVGNNNLEEIIELAEKFSVSRKGKTQKLPRKHLHSFKQKEQRAGIQQATLALGFHFPKASQVQRYPAMIFSKILGSGMSSRLFTEVREKRGLAYAISSGIDIGRDFGYLIIYAGTDKSKVDDVIGISLDEFKKMKKLSKKELKDCKRQLLGNRTVARETTSAVVRGKLYKEIAGNTEDPLDFEEQIERVSLEDVTRLAEISNYASFVLTP